MKSVGPYILFKVEGRFLCKWWSRREQSLLIGHNYRTTQDNKSQVWHWGQDSNTHWSSGTGTSLGWSWWGRMTLILAGGPFPILLINSIHKWLGKCLWNEAIGETCEMERGPLASTLPQLTTPQPKWTHWKTEACTSIFSMINLTVSLWNLKGRKNGSIPISHWK